MRRKRVAPGEWVVSALNDHRCRVDVARVYCARPATPELAPELRIEILAPALLGAHVGALVPPPEVAA